MWASREQEPAEVLAEAFAEAPRRDPQHQRPWMAAGDGNEHQLNLLERLRAVYGVEMDIVRDFPTSVSTSGSPPTPCVARAAPSSSSG